MINIQQDNSVPHIKEGDPDLVAASRASGLEITLYLQPTNIPDLNVLDMGYLKSIQPLQYNIPPSNVDKIIQAVK